MSERTPYAVLLVRPSDDDRTIRKAYHALAEIHHPDANGGKPGPLWHCATTAYNAIKTDEARSRWAASQHLLSGICEACAGTGVAGTRMFRGVIKACAACRGAGRVP